MEKGNVFFNVTLSFWTIPNQNAKINNVPPNRQQPLPPASNHKTTIAEPVNKPHFSLFEDSLAVPNTYPKKIILNESFSSLKILLKNRTNAGSSSGTRLTDSGLKLVDEQSFVPSNVLSNVDISNNNTGGLFGDKLDSGQQSPHSNSSVLRSLSESVSSLRTRLQFASHYHDSSIVHLDSKPSIHSISESAASTVTESNFTPLNSSTNLTLWNLTFTESTDWADTFYLNRSNNILTDTIECLDNGLLQKHSGCTLPSNNSNLTTEFDLFGQHERVYWALFLIILPILALFGNILVILSVYRERSLQTVTNWFIVSLAFADLFVTIPMLFSLYVMVNVDWELSELICDLYIAIDVVCSTASIFNLVAISFDRYIAVTHPIFYSKHKNDKRVIFTIILVWICSSSVGLPIILGANTSPERTPELCIFYNSDFIIYSSLWSFYVPCLIMVVLYYKIFKAIHDRARKKIDSTKNKTKNYNSNKNSNISVSAKVNDAKIHTQALENISLSKQIQLKCANAIKLDQIKTDNQNCIPKSVALISDIDVQAAEFNDDINDDDDDDDDLDEEQADYIEIDKLDLKCSNKLNTNTNCSIYTNKSPVSESFPRQSLNNLNVDSACVANRERDRSQHTSCQVCIEPNDTHSPVFIVEDASSNLKSQHPLNSSTTNGTSSSSTRPPSDSVNKANEARDNASPSGSTSITIENVAKNGNNATTVNNTSNNSVKKTIVANDNSVVNNDSTSTKCSKKKSRFNLGRKHKSSRKKREKASAKRERKATKTLAIVLGVFLLCWTPFFSCNILDAICIKLHENHFIQSDCRPGITAFLLTTWLGYMNSCANPLIYTIFNPEFRKAFRKILCKN